MAKAKAGVIPNKVLYSRMSYMHQAATYLATQQQHSKGDTKQTASLDTQSEKGTTMEGEYTKEFLPISRRFITEVRILSQKTKIRMSPAMKYTMCKYCDTVLVEGSTCTNEVENKSKGGKKPWAEVLVRRCNTCGLAKRFQMAMERQKRRSHRSPKAADGQEDKVT